MDVFNIWDVVQAAVFAGKEGGGHRVIGGVLVAAWAYAPLDRVAPFDFESLAQLTSPIALE